MLTFKKLTWEDREIFTKYYNETPTHYAEYAFSTLWAWEHSYPIEIAVNDDKNLIWLRSGGPLPGYFGAVGNWNNVKDWEKELSDFKTGDLIYDVPEDMRNILSELFPNNLRFTEDRDQHEYVYSVKELTELKGKNFAHKRNRVRAFLDGYEWDYYEMGKKDFDEVMDFQERWRIHRDSTLSEDEAQSLYDEDLAIQNCLNKWEEFNFMGGILKVDGKIIAYTIAEELDEKNIDVHFEKAFGEYAGSYQAINYMFLKNQASKYEFANREEDMGEPGLREAKLSYNPVKMLKKYQMEIL